MRESNALVRALTVAALALLLAACGGTKKKRFGQLCQSDSTCPSGSLCVDGRCAALQSCQSSAECGIGVCSGGYCWTEQCSDSSSCPGSLQCLEGYCIRGAETIDASDSSSEDQNITKDQGGETQCNVDADCADKVGQLGPCEEPACTQGQCGKRNKPKDSSCEDGDKCTGPDKCDDAGVCQPGANICECQKDADCANLDAACTKGTCNLQTNKCEATPINEGNECNDGNVCTINDTCKSGVCKGDPCFGLSCGSGVDEHCDQYGQCVKWVETQPQPPAFSDGISCTSGSDCPGTGYDCEGGMCVCNKVEGCDCEPNAPAACKQGQICYVYDNPQQPGTNVYRCTYQSFRYSGVCRLPQNGGDDTLYLMGINLVEEQPNSGPLDVVLSKMENGSDVERQLPITSQGLYYARERLLCSGPIAAYAASGEGTAFIPLRLDSQNKWKKLESLYGAIFDMGGSGNVFGPILSLAALTLPNGKVASYWGGYLRAGSLQGPDDVDPRSHEDFVVRCVDDTQSPSGFSCTPRFLKPHDDTTVVHTQTLPSGVTRPPYDPASFQMTTHGMIGALVNGVEQIQTLTSAAYIEYLSVDDPPNWPGSFYFQYWASLVSSPTGYWNVTTPPACGGWPGGPCEGNASTDLSINGGMRDIDIRQGKTVIAGLPLQVAFDLDNRKVNQLGTPPISPLYYHDGSQWTVAKFPPANVIQDPQHFSFAPYDYVFDHVRFLDEKSVLIVGHYRTCLTDGCYSQIDNEVIVTVKVQPFVTTFNLGDKSFGPMIRIGGGSTRECCVDGACQAIPSCVGYELATFWRGARIATVGLRQRTDGLEIYMVQNPVSDTGSYEDIRYLRLPKVYSFISVAP